MQGLESISLGSLWTAFRWSKTRQEFGTIYGNDFLKDNFGRKIIAMIGSQKEEIVVAWKYKSSWYGGFTNKIRFKNFTLSSLISAQVAGSIYSYASRDRLFFGKLMSVVYRRETEFIEEGIQWIYCFENDNSTSALLKQFTDIFSMWSLPQTSFSMLPTFKNLERWHYFWFS